MITAVLLVSMVALTVQAYAMSAAESTGIDMSRRGSITLSVDSDSWYIEGAVFRLYKAADLNPDLSFSYTDKFRSYAEAAGIDIQPVSLTDSQSLTASKWQSAASQLISLVTENNIQEDAREQMSSRSCTFDSIGGQSGLSLGLYLIQGDSASESVSGRTRKVVYQPELICIPQRMLATDSWTYDVADAVVKSAVETVSTETPQSESQSETDQSETQSETGESETQSESDTEQTEPHTPDTDSPSGGEGGSSSSGTTPVKTGDSTPVGMTALIMAFAAVAVMALGLKIWKRNG